MSKWIWCQKRERLNDKDVVYHKMIQVTWLEFRLDIKNEYFMNYESSMPCFALLCQLPIIRVFIIATTTMTVLWWQARPILNDSIIIRRLSFEVRFSWPSMIHLSWYHQLFFSNILKNFTPNSQENAVQNM